MKQEDIIEKIENLEFIKEYKVLKDKLSKNNKYKELSFRLKNTTDKDEIIKIRKSIYKIEDYKNLMHLDVNIRLLVNQINKNISSILNNKKC